MTVYILDYSAMAKAWVLIKEGANWKRRAHENKEQAELMARRFLKFIQIANYNQPAKLKVIRKDGTVEIETIHPSYNPNNK